MSETFCVAELIQDGILVINDGYRAKNDELGPEGLPFARAGNIDQGFNFDGADLLAFENVPRAGEKVSEPGDVLFTSKGTVGRMAYVLPTTPRFVYSPQLSFWRVVDSAQLCPRYLFYWMHGAEFLRQCHATKGQTDMADFISLTDQREMTITLPPIGDQQAIASILEALDDRIDLSRRMSETLSKIKAELLTRALTDKLSMPAVRELALELADCGSAPSETSRAPASD